MCTKIFFNMLNHSCRLLLLFVCLHPFFDINAQTSVINKDGKVVQVPIESPFYLQGSTSDAGNNKTDRIWRTGGIMLGDGVNSSNTTFNGYFLARGNMTISPTPAIFSFENTAHTNTGIFAGNGGGVNFLPNLRLSSSGAWRSIIIGEISTDSGGEPALQFRSQIQGLGTLVNRPSFTWVNGIAADNEQMRLTANGRLGLNATGPLARLTVDDKSYITNLPTTTSNLMDNTNYRAHTRFQNTSGSNNNALSIYSTTGAWAMQAHNYSTGASLPLVLQAAGGNVGIGTTNPVTQFANTSSIIQGNGSTNAFVGGLVWSTTGTGYVGTFYNASPDNGNGLQVKINGRNAAQTVMDLTSGLNNTVTYTHMRILGDGKVGIGTASPLSKLDINGSATNTSAYNAGTGTTIDFSLSNLAYTSASAGAFTLTNIKDGGTYTLAVQGETSGISSFTSTGFTFKSPNNGTTTASKHTLYTFIVMGSTVYYYMVTGL